MTIKLNNNKGKKLKCKRCKQLIFFVEDDVILEKGIRYVVCDCGEKIKLKRI